MKERAYYQRQIWKYEQRRRDLKGQHGNFSGRTRHITRKIASWKLQIRRIDKRNEKLRTIISAVNEYFDVNIESKCMDLKHKQARKIYYKYACENNIQGAFVSKAINRASDTAAEARLFFTRSFSSIPENKKIYHHFVNYIK